jgi:hemerythrin-like domain-containing protein
MEHSHGHGFYQHHRFAKPTEVLSDEHRVIERVLAAMEKLLIAPPAPSLSHWKKALDFISNFADQCHHLKEEKLLFPAMEAHGIPREGGPIGMMLMEHEEGRSHVRAMRAAVEGLERGETSGVESLLSHARGYLRLLKEHIQKEDEILFRIADDCIPAGEQTALLKSFEEHETRELGAGVHEKYLAVAQELEAALNNK